MHYLKFLLHPDPSLQSVLLQSGHLPLQAGHYTLPPLEGALWDSLGQVLQDLKVLAQELEELLTIRREYHD